MKRKLRGLIIGLFVVAVIFTTDAITSNAATNFNHKVQIIGTRGYSFFTNNCGNERYFVNSIFKTTNANSTSNGTCLISKSSAYLDGKSDNVNVNLSGITHAYGKVAAYKGNVYNSGVAATSVRILK